MQSFFVAETLKYLCASRQRKRLRTVVADLLFTSPEVLPLGAKRGARAVVTM